MKALVRLAVVAAALASCSGCGEPVDLAPGELGSAQYAGEGEPHWRLDFTPDPELEGVTEVALERWGAATGLDLRIVAAGGLPLRVVAPGSIVDGKGKRRAGKHTPGVEIQIDLPFADRIASVEHVLTHEIGHALGVRGHLGERAGMMGAGSVDRITTADLEAVCEHQPCNVFAPEAQKARTSE